ncbi:hypothetical protein EAT51_02885 [Pseudoxanthomonas winnipegensis]|uniref:hypothetical protein n=1 Tax=Pseudoxanthomonas winnipegensis TaxID=2480810 RepID=UPI00102E013F|nr:hypothetical protein [Pseudoxanthomonas winnipegensis]TAA44348.1 hypothetical protein EAT51_02885 [Pseudoxanthomonas winnipegensis]
MKNLLLEKKSAVRLLLMMLLFVVIFLLFSLRNLDPVTYPSLYAEDGTWIGDLLTKGFHETAFGTRVFPIVGFIIFLQIADWIVNFFLGGNLYYLPLVLFVLSNLFSAGMVCVAISVFRDRLPFWGIASIVISILLLPVGNDANEIYGRILNLGFMFPYLQTLLLLPLFFPRRRRLGVAFGLVFSLISGLTFPVGIGVAGFACGLLLLRFVRRRHRGDLVAALLVGLTALVPLLTLTGQTFSDSGGASMPLKPEAWLEFAVARAFLYPLIFWFYRALSDVWVLSLLAAAIFAVTTHLWRTRSSSALPAASKGYPLYLFWGATFINLAAMLVMRSGLSSIFDSYTSTFPDRYFTGLNLLFFTSVVMTACRSKGGQVIGVMLAVPFVATAGERFELAKPSMHWHSVPTWTKSICKTAKSNGKRTYIQIAPEGFSIKIPKEELTSTLLDRCNQVGSRAYSDIPLLSSAVPDNVDAPPSLTAIRYEGRVVSRTTQDGTREDGWFYVTEGRRRWILDGGWLKKQGLEPTDIMRISAAELADIPEDPSPITTATAAIAPSSDVFNPADRYDGKVVTRAPLDGSRQDGWFYVKNGKRRWIADGEWLTSIGLEPKDIQRISAEDLSAIPEDPQALEVSTRKVDR